MLQLGGESSTVGLNATALIFVARPLLHPVTLWPWIWPFEHDVIDDRWSSTPVSFTFSTARQCCRSGRQFHNIYTVRHRLHAITHGAVYIYIYIYANRVQLIWVLCSHATEWPVGLLVECSLAIIYIYVSAVRFLGCLTFFGILFILSSFSI